MATVTVSLIYGQQTTEEEISQDTLPLSPSYYDLPYDPEARSPLQLDQHRRPPFDLRRKRLDYLYPKSYKRTLSLDTGLNYTLREQLGDLNYRPPMRVPFEAYADRRRKETIRNYWRSRTREQDGQSPVSSRSQTSPRIYVGPLA